MKNKIKILIIIVLSIIILNFESYSITFRNVERIAGEDRFSTAINVSKKGFSSADTAIIVSASSFPDALSASAVSNAYNAPILFVGKELSNELKAELSRLNVKNIFIIGLDYAVSNKVENDLKGLNYNINRIGGDDRYKTSIMVAKYLLNKKLIVDSFVLARGDDFADALSASSYASKNNMPIILSRTTSITKDLNDYIKGLSSFNCTIIGGEFAISINLENKLKNFGMVKRFAGEDRYQTAIKIANESYPNYKNVIFANGHKFADAMVGGTLTKKLQAPILLTSNTYMSEDVYKIFLNAGAHINNVYIIGGINVVSEYDERILKNTNKYTVVLKDINNQVIESSEFIRGEDIELYMGPEVPLKYFKAWRDQEGNIIKKINFIDKNYVLTPEYGDANAYNYNGKNINFQIVSENFKSDFLKIINEGRKKVGAPALVYEADFQEGANIRAVEIAALFEHTRPNGGSFVTAFSGPKLPISENIAGGAFTAQMVYDMWYASTQGHKEAMLNPDFKMIGLGAVMANPSEYGYYWVLVFGG